MTQKDLEDTLKEKVTPLLEETMEKSLGVSIPKMEKDITDKLTTPFLDIYVSFDLPFSKAKKEFKKQFLKKELRMHVGNISELAKDLGLDRRSIHRVIKDLEISMDDFRKVDAKERYKEGLVDSAIRSGMEGYREILRPEKLEDMYQEVPKLSRNIAKLLPHAHLTWKEAEREFEKQFLGHALKEHDGSVSKAAHQLQIRVETLHRKIKKLGLK
ncbi:TPA: hypothetical protein HA278_05670 [Candidatus Woesearchaeota archaeon]|nr:hypothetical protein [archaeon]HIJ11518.1 hypothetical protein [Candidatus Woesearchaeota archaeon]|tara:strand:- start:80 stop:721 length:642 start_codon:yes stop_codon:yes gene_type:complete